MKYGRLVVIEKSDRGEGKILCRCDCGIFVHVYDYNLKSGRTKSCGCYQRFKVTKHGFAGTPTYASYRDMLTRCYNSKCRNYPYYGGRGIKVCERWHKSFVNFLDDMGEMPAGLTLERKNNNSGYSKENCKWASHAEQIANQRPKRKRLAPLLLSIGVALGMNE
jgi:hypothetical protein